MTPAAVRWEIESGPGSIDQTGLYTAPANATAAVRAVVRAIADADASAKGTAQVDVEPIALGAHFALGVRLGVAGGFDTGTEVRDRAELLVDAVIEATRLAGTARPVLTGTLRLVGNAFALDRVPTDRLVLDLGARERSQFFVTTLTGDISVDGRRFLSRTHRLAMRVLDVGVDATITHARDGDQLVRTVRGTLPLAEKRPVVDVTERELIDSELTPGIDFRALTEVAGTIDVDGVHVDLDESLETRIAISNRAVEQFKRFQRSSWTVGTQRFTQRDVAIFSLFVDTRGDEFDFWRGEGSVLLHGEEVGRLESSFEPNDFVIRLRLGPQVFEARRIPVFVR